MAYSPRSRHVTREDGSTVLVLIRHERPFELSVTVSRCVICERVNAILGDD